eukprot:8517418-Alexandrium_andersonii.AAC.1
MTYEVLREELAGVLHQPEHHRMAHRDPPLESLPKRQHQGADQPLELPRRILDGTVGLRFVRRRRLEH